VLADGALPTLQSVSQFRTCLKRNARTDEQIPQKGANMCKFASLKSYVVQPISLCPRHDANVYQLRSDKVLVRESLGVPHYALLRYDKTSWAKRNRM